MIKKLRSAIVTLTALSLAIVPAAAIPSTALAVDLKGSLCSGTNSLRGRRASIVLTAMMTLTWVAPAPSQWATVLSTVPHPTG